MCICSVLFNPLWPQELYSPPGPSVHGISQAKILERVAIPSPGDLPDPGVELTSLVSLALTGGFFTSWVTTEAQKTLIVIWYQIKFLWYDILFSDKVQDISKLTPYLVGFLDGSMVKNPPSKQEMWIWFPGWGRSPGEVNGNPLQYSCLGNPMDRGAWRATVYGAIKEWNMT